MATCRDNLEDLETNGQLGDWCFTDCDYQGERITLMFLRYPLSDEVWQKHFSKYWDPKDQARGDLIGLPLGGDPGKHPVWQWNGNRECPTLSPSINVIGYWHGWLREGKLITA